MGFVSFFSPIFRPHRRMRQRLSHARFNEAIRGLTEHDVAIDCGAHIGKYTRLLAASGARVYAFEPNPYAFEVLERTIAGMANVKCFNKAVGAEPGRQKLYLDRRTPQNPVRFATGSSLLSIKRNVDLQNSVEVDVVDLAQFIHDIGEPIKVVKMDVEGAEVDILSRLLQPEHRSLQIDAMFVEMHDHKIPELGERAGEIRRRIADENLHWIDLRWH